VHPTWPEDEGVLSICLKNAEKQQSEIALLYTAEPSSVSLSSEPSSEYCMVTCRETKHMMEPCHRGIHVKKRGFLGTTRLQIIYKAQLFSDCGLPNISVSPCQLIWSGTGIQTQYHRPRTVPLISCNCSSPEEETRSPTTKHNRVGVSLD